MKGAAADRKIGFEPGNKLFGTDGIRGRANEFPMCGEVMFELGRALAMVYRLGPTETREHRVLIAKDTRRSGYMLEDALASGICSMGVNVLQVGPMPTPGLAFLTADMRCDAGAMISASHNSFEDNGVKFFSANGLKLPDFVEEHIESLMFSDELQAARPVGADIGRAQRIDDARAAKRRPSSRASPRTHSPNAMMRAPRFAAASSAARRASALQAITRCATRRKPASPGFGVSAISPAHPRSR